MEVVLPLAVVCVLVSAAPNATRARHPDDLPEEPVLPDDDEELLHKLDYYDEERINISEKGMYLGSPCEFTCNPKLMHVYCDPTTASCQCDPKHPVAVGVAQGCAKAKKLGEQCFYRETCKAFDSHASCVQVNHNAYCQCDSGYHQTSHTRPTNRIFCTEDLVLLTADMPTLLGVASGIFVLAGLLCMVLHLYTKARYHPTHLADARLTPPCLYSLNDTGGTLSGTRASSRASSRSGCTSGTLDERDGAGSRRASRRAGVAVSASRAGAARTAAILLISRHLKAVRRDGGAHPPKCAAKGSRRPSLTSVQSSSSSIRSYSARRWEREREQKERRQMSMRLAQLHDKMAAGREMPKHAPTPSPRSPNNSTDGLLPSVCEIRELITNPEQQLQGVDGPCSSSSLY
ncbi:uncharacterized protein LOC118268665 isoform X1 [Spodoptera frugiperda]|uniref:Uncharacterized protein LOC118268665 isoform X1 n=1 Tax=Spodoptera frugiperda TaxID=7108 RepID=A0A9R0D3W5_SPOFR|nr:uncharacterized protein LOC118268665 isoform X1 [Spodoptera frugiperda]XP_035439131.2 uncharacterized protein LOC118268665 isoform X1 [Spodoptera frugiperda]